MTKKMIELNKIYNEDCLEGLKRIPDGTVDMICTDPPYCVGTTSNGHKGTFLDNNLVKPFFEQLFTEWERVLRDGAHIYINTDWRTYPFLYPILVKHFPVRNLIVWDYEWIKAGTFYRFSHEFIVFATKGDSKAGFSRSERDVWRIKPINFTSKDKLHQAQKPSELVERMITNSTRVKETVLDCFMGSGTTAVACIETRRNYIGFEIDEGHWNTSMQRVKKAEETLHGLVAMDNMASI